MKFEGLFTVFVDSGMSGKFCTGKWTVQESREIFLTGTNETGSRGIPVPYRTVRKISHTVATLSFFHQNDCVSVFIKCIFFFYKHCSQFPLVDTLLM
jgi:hypothetical protein